MGPSFWARAVFSVLVVLMIMLIAMVAPRIRDFERFLSGFWSGESGFLRKAGLSDMFLYIAPCERLGGRWVRQGYLVLVDSAGAVISNQAIEMSWGGLLGRWKSALKSSVTASADETYKVGTVYLEYDHEAIMPETMSLGLNVTKGTLVLYEDHKVFAFLVKDNEVSITANAVWQQGCDV